MFYTDYKLQFPVRVEDPNPVFAKALQQAIGGIEGEIRVAMQYMFQAWGVRGDNKYREMLLNTGAEELGHIEMLATAVALNLQTAPLSFQEDIYASGNIAADMYANVTAEATGRTLAVRLFNMSNDPGMKEMLAFLIATPCTRTSGRR